MKNKKSLLVVLLIVVCMAVLIIIISKDEKQDEPNDVVGEITNSGEKITAPSKIEDDEKAVSSKKAKELYNFIPKAYTEEIAPFTSLFMLDTVMNKIRTENENIDYSTENVDNYVIKLFGSDAKINKKEVSEPDISKSLYYYSKEADSYAVIPVGYEGIFKTQIFKNATETKDAYYVYTYTLIGGYAYDEENSILDDLGNIDYENSKVQVIVGDKDGNDLVHTFENFEQMHNEDVWKKNYSNVMPVFRYTLKKENNNYYVTEVEQINY